MNAHVSHPPLEETPFIPMVGMCCITLCVTLLNLSHLASDMVPYFQLAALSVTILVGYKTLTKPKKKDEQRPGNGRV